jgi:hypothetical protein
MDRQMLLHAPISTTHNRLVLTPPFLLKLLLPKHGHSHQMCSSEEEIRAVDGTGSQTDQ